MQSLGFSAIYMLNFKGKMKTCILVVNDCLLFPASFSSSIFFLNTVDGDDCGIIKALFYRNIAFFARSVGFQC